MCQSFLELALFELRTLDLRSDKHFWCGEMLPRTARLFVTDALLNDADKNVYGRSL